MTEDAKRERIREALRTLLVAMNEHSGHITVQMVATDRTLMGDRERRYVYNAELTFAQRETL